MLGIRHFDQQVELLAVAGHQIFLHQAPVLLLLVGVGGLRVRRGKETPEDRLVGLVEQGAELRAQLAQHRPVVVAEIEKVATVPVSPDDSARQEGAQLSCSMVAHKPCSWRRNTSSSAFSLGPCDTTAFPL